MKNADILGRLIDILNSSIGSFALFFKNVSLSLVFLLFTIEVISSAIDVVTGKGFTAPRKLIIYISLIVLIASWGSIYKDVSNNAITGSGLKKNFSHLWKKVIIKHKLPTILLAPRGIKGLINSELNINLNKADLIYILKVIFAYISLFFSLILMVVIIVIIGKNYAILLIQLSLGMVPIGLMMSAETRSEGFRWTRVIFSRFLTIYLYSFAVKFSLDLIQKNIYSVTSAVPGILDMDYYIPTVLSILLILFLFKILSNTVRSFIG